MDDDNLTDVSFTDLDLNQEPTEAPLRSVARVGSLLNELETAHGRIEERIRQLEGVTARARQRQRWRHERNSIEINHISSEMVVDVNGARGVLDRDGVSNAATVERTVEKGKGCKRDSSHLIAKALEMGSEVKKADKEGGSFYDCNICLDMAREPVLTCCGHLFCWACFYQVSDIDLTSKECPVCKGEVSNSTIIPIYGNGGSEPVCETETGLKIPPRPKAHRVESVRQQRATHGLSHVPVAEALRRIRISIGSMGHQSQQQEGGGGILNLDTESHEGTERIRFHQVSRVLSESAASLSSLSSALSNAERLVEDLETVINSQFPQIGGAMLQPNNQLSDSRADNNAALPVITSSSQSADVSGSGLRILTMRSSSEISLPVTPSYSFRRRSIISRTSDVDGRDTRESRRRRLN